MDPLTNWNTAPVGGCSFIQVATLACANEAPDAPITAHLAWRLVADSEVIPKPWLVPGFQTVALGVEAFVAGWEIGSAINATFLHINGVGLGNTQARATPGHISRHRAGSIALQGGTRSLAVRLRRPGGA